MQPTDTDKANYHKSLSGTGPTYIGSLFQYRHTQYGLRGEGLNLELPNFNLNMKRVLSLIYLRYGTVCPFKNVFQVMQMTSKVNCKVVAFWNVSYCLTLTFLVYS